jgi:predicted porin
MKSIFATGLLACAMPVLAQSTVTIYGVVDAYAQHLDGQSRLSRVQSGGLNGSRLGFRSVEDLGGGLRAVFTLESGFNVDDGTIGQGGAFYGRQAFVGLQGGWGEVTLGRQYSSIYHATNDLSVFGNQPAGPSAAVIGGFGGGYELVRGASSSAPGSSVGATGNGSPARVNNSVRFASPSFSGFRFSTLFGAGEAAGSTSDTRLFDVAVRYTDHGFDGVLSYLDDRAQRGGAADTRASIVTLAGSYSLAPFRIVAGYIDFDDKRSDNLDGQGYWLGGEYRLSAHTLKAQFVHNKPKSGGDNETKAFGIGWAFAFSNRTSVYTSLTRFDNDGNAGVGGLGRFNSAIPQGLTATGDNSITEFVAGVRHVF